MVDRLTHKAFLVNMNGNSYRVKETKNWILQQQQQQNAANDKQIAEKSAEKIPS